MSDGMRRRVLACLAAGVVCVLVAGGAFAWYFLGYIPDSHSGSATIPSGQYFSFEFLVFGSGVEIGYRFIVEAGPNIDVYLLTLDEFAQYQTGQPFQDVAFSHEDVRTVDGSPYFNDGRYRAVIDNTAYGVAQPSGSAAIVRYDLNAGGRPGWDNLLGDFVGAALLFAATIAFVATVVLMAAPPMVEPPAFCPFCGFATSSWVCSRCRRASPVGRPPK